MTTAKSVRELQRWSRRDPKDIERDKLAKELTIRARNLDAPYGPQASNTSRTAVTGCRG